MKMKWILLILVLHLFTGCNKAVTPSAEAEVQDKAPVVEPVQRNIVFVGWLVKLDRDSPYCSIPWVGTFENEDDKRERFVIGGNDHPLLRELRNSGGIVKPDAMSKATFNLEGRSCPIEGVWELTSWEKTKD
jgi:hypothetical protein